MNIYRHHKTTMNHQYAFQTKNFSKKRTTNKHNISRKNYQLYRRIVKSELWYIPSFCKSNDEANFIHKNN